jgi:hypothetical protein
MAEEVDFEKLARDTVSSRVEPLKNAPAAAGEIAKKLIVTALLSGRVSEGAPLVIRKVCRGVMGGLLIIGKSLPECAVEVLKALGEDAAHEVHVDPNDLMTWAMAGIADVAPAAGVDVRSAMRDAIEERYMGAGPVFAKLADAAERAASK